MEKKKVFSAVCYAAAGVSGAVMSIALFDVLKSSLLWVAGGACVFLVLLCLYDIGVIAWLIKKIRPNTTSSWWEKYIGTRQLYLAAAFLFFLLLISLIMGLSVAPTRVDKEHFINDEEYHVLEAYLDGYVTNNSFENKEWLEAYSYLEGKSFTDEQLSVLTYYIMWCGEDFPRTTVAKKLLSGEKIISSDFSEDYSYHKLWILRAVWDGKISYKEIRNWPNGTVYLIDIDNLKYDRKGKAIVTKELRKRLKIGPLTAEEILDVGYIPPADTSVAVKKYNGGLLYYTGVPWRIYDLDEEYEE